MGKTVVGESRIEGKKERKRQLLEGKEYRSWQEMGWDEGYCIGLRLGALEVMIDIYRGTLRDGTSMDILLHADEIRGKVILSEMARFHEQYGHLSAEKMAEHMLIESEYLLEC